MMKSLLIHHFIPALLLLRIGSANELQCQLDCRSDPRLVGPTRPSDDIDALGNPLLLTKPHPHKSASDSDFSRFCELGCTYFYLIAAKAGNDKSINTLGRCMQHCDDTYTYNVTVGYNDAVETARLECRDGCQMGLIRCGAGHFCTQVSFQDGERGYSGGDMRPCPAGTYREGKFDNVSECIPCPPNHFREDIKGKSLSSCSKCPANTSSGERSTSIKDCKRCRAGTTSTEGNSCKCISPQACDENQLPFPADAEKRDSIPFIGRW